MSAPPLPILCKRQTINNRPQFFEIGDEELKNGFTGDAYFIGNADFPSRTKDNAGAFGYVRCLGGTPSLSLSSTLVAPQISRVPLHLASVVRGGACKHPGGCNVCVRDMAACGLATCSGQPFLPFLWLRGTCACYMCGHSRLPALSQHLVAVSRFESFVPRLTANSMFLSRSVAIGCHLRACLHITT